MEKKRKDKPTRCRQCGQRIGTNTACAECGSYLVESGKVWDKVIGRLEDAGYVDATKPGPGPPPTQDQALDVLLAKTAELSAAGCADAAVMGAVLMLGANSAGLMAAASPRFLEDLRDKPSSQPLGVHIYHSCQALLELYQAGVGEVPERRDMTGVIVALRDALGKIPAAFEDSLMCLEKKVKYLAPEQQGALLWEALGVILEHHVPEGVDGHDVAVKIFNGTAS